MLESLSWSDLLTFASGVIAALLAYWATQTKAKSEKEATLPSGWRDLTAEIRDYYGGRLGDTEDRLAVKKELLDRHVCYLRYVDMRLIELGVEDEVLDFQEWQLSRD